MCDTWFDSPERASATELEAQCRTVRDEPNVCRMLDLQPEPTVVLNAQRQIVFANRACAPLFGANPGNAVGQRLGEAIKCVHACKPPAGCGTTTYCGVCGAARTIRDARLTQRDAASPCRITRQAQHGPESLELQVWTTPLVLGAHSFTVVAARDASNEQRRHVLERMFFHDLLNTSGALKMLLALGSKGALVPSKSLATEASRLTAQLVDEIEAHRDLLAAERGELVPQPADVPVLALLEEVARVHSHQRAVAIHVTRCSASAVVNSDRVMLRRILTNLLKNAIEASEAGDRVELAFHTSSGPAFDVTNSGMMPAEAQLQVFQRSFSTKAPHGRGLGTYGARLLAERYLNSRVSFESSAERGTTFTLSLPASALVSE